MRRQGRIAEQENPDRWVVSYADFITLLFAFFTVLYAVSRVDSAKLGEFVGSTRAAFGPRAAARAKPVIEGIAPVFPAAGAGPARRGPHDRDVRGVGRGLRPPGRPGAGPLAGRARPVRTGRAQV
jgi:flagellar motor protein MotB